MKPKRLNALVPLLLCLLIPSTAMSAPAVKEVEVNGVRLSYVEQGAGEPIVFVHGAFSDFRVFHSLRPVRTHHPSPIAHQLSHQSTNHDLPEPKPSESSPAV